MNGALLLSSLASTPKHAMVSNATQSREGMARILAAFGGTAPDVAWGEVPPIDVLLVADDVYDLFVAMDFDVSEVLECAAELVPEADTQLKAFVWADDGLLAYSGGVHFPAHLLFEFMRALLEAGHTRHAKSGVREMLCNEDWTTRVLAVRLLELIPSGHV